MKIAGSRDLPAPPERVWAALAAPDVLAVAVPRCHEAEGEPSVRLTFDWRLAALDGMYVAGVEVLSAEPAETATLRVSARGEPGAVTATVRARLEAHDDGARLDWEAECEAFDRLAAVGGRLLEAGLRRQADALLDGIEQHLAGEPVEADATAAAPPPSREPAEPPPRRDARTLAAAAPADARDTERVAIAAVAGALAALVLVWLIQRLRSAR